MDLRQLRYFLAVAELGSITSAAEKLNITQPALGQQIRNLEDHFGFSLLDRHSRGVSLTEAGKRFQDHAEDILSHTARAEADMQRFSDAPVGTVHIGVTPSIGRWLVPSVLEAAADRYPQVTLQFTQAFSDQLDAQFDTGGLELSLTHKDIETERAETLPLLVERICVIGRPEILKDLSDPLPLRALSEIPMVLDDRSKLVRKLVDTALASIDAEMTDVIDIHAINIRRELVMKGSRCSLAPPAMFDEELKAGMLTFRPVDEPSFTRTVHLASRRVEDLLPSVAAIRALIVSLVDEKTRSNQKGWSMPRSAEGETEQP